LPEALPTSKSSYIVERMTAIFYQYCKEEKKLPFSFLCRQKFLLGCTFKVVINLSLPEDSTSKSRNIIMKRVTIIFYE